MNSWVSGDSAASNPGSSNTEDKSMIWQPWTAEPHTFNDLSVDARLVLGIITTCVGYSEREVADLCFKSVSYIRKLIRQIRASEDPVVVEILRNGLPLESMVHIPQRRRVLRCKDCNQGLAYFPCARCKIEQQLACADDLRRKPNRKRKEKRPRKPKRTDCAPGTQEKIEVMRQRATKGMAVFADDDLTFL